MNARAHQGRRGSPGQHPHLNPLRNRSLREKILCPIRHLVGLQDLLLSTHAALLQWLALENCHLEHNDRTTWRSADVHMPNGLNIVGQCNTL
jgi:hypothetical protein